MGTSSNKLPDPWQTAQAQLAMQRDLNTQTTKLNRPNQITPWGSTTWDKNKNTQTQTLPENVQRALSSQQATGATLAEAGGQLAPNAINSLNTPLNTEGLQSWTALDDTTLGAMPTADDATRRSVQDAQYSKFTTVMDPEYQQRENSLLARLAAQGITPSSGGAWDTEVGNFSRNRNLAYTQALNDAILGGQQAEQQQFQRGMAARAARTGEIQSNNALRGQQLQERALLRQQPLQDLTALYSFGQPQSPQMPNFTNSPTSSSPDYAGMVGNNYAAQLAGGAANNALAGQLVGAGLNAATSNTALQGYQWLAKNYF
jgi:hypothetical protein